MLRVKIRVRVIYSVTLRVCHKVKVRVKVSLL